VVLGLCAALLAGLVHIGYFSTAVFSESTLPVPVRRETAAVIFSGDMGYRVGMSPQIGARLVDAGIPVIGVNSLVFAHRQGSLRQAQAMVAQAVRRAIAFGRVRRIILIGQSFGADMLHAGLTGLPAALRAKVTLVILVVPTDKIYFSIGPREYFELGRPDQYALATARMLDWVPVTCISGADETDSLCPKLVLPNVRKIVLPGGHPLHHDADALFAAIRDAIAHHGR
jgi:type IV secretory pathway VirJ component